MDCIKNTKGCVKLIVAMCKMFMVCLMLGTKMGKEGKQGELRGANMGK